jgi:integrase
LGPGKHLGYRPGVKQGHWIARSYTSTAAPKKQYKSLGAADGEGISSDGEETLTFEQAIKAANAWFGKPAKTLNEQVVPDYSVAKCIEDYIAEQRRIGNRGADRARQSALAHIIPKFGLMLVSELTPEGIETWLGELSETGKRRRTMKGATKPVLADAPATPEDKRRRKDSANRVWTTFRAALNLAAKRKKPGCDRKGWAEVQDFKKVSAARSKHFMPIEIIPFLSACPPDFRRLSAGAVHTGARYGELAKLRIEHLDFNNNTLLVPAEIAKTKVARFINLLDEAPVFFAAITAGRARSELIFLRDDVVRRKRTAGKNAWLESDQFRFMNTACDSAQIERCNFHGLRHTAVSRWLNDGASLGDVAEQIGDSEATTRKHYAHLCPDSRGARLRRVVTSLGINRICLGNSATVQPITESEGIDYMMMLG